MIGCFLKKVVCAVRNISVFINNIFQCIIFAKKVQNDFFGVQFLGVYDYLEPVMKK